MDDNALELSNVNISTEFSDLIIAQRAFEANSKTMTTSDAISEAVMAMVRYREGRTNPFDRFVFHAGFEKHNRSGVTARHPLAVLMDSAFAVLSALVVI